MNEENGRRSVTETLHEYLEGPANTQSVKAAVLASTADVLEAAQEEGLTLSEYVKLDPEKAQKQAEACLGQWLNLQTQASITGYVVTDGGKFLVNKNMAALLKERVTMAERQMNYINDLVFNATKDTEKRREHLTRVLYNRAVNKNDTRALMYLIDRVDGRPAEAAQVAIDIDYQYNVYQLLHGLFDKQLEVLNSGPGTKLICCSRQSGKSMLFAATALIEAMRVPGTTVMYIGQTLELTEGILDQSCNYFIDKFQLRDKKGKRFNWRRIDNGSQILVRGLSNTKDPDMIRGQRSRVVIVDEFFHLKSELLEYMIREVLEPMQMSFGHDYLFIAGGTPPPIKGLFGEIAWQKWDVPHFLWTFRDNPYPADPKEKEDAITQKLREKGLDWDSVYARREYNGEWIYDDDLLLYPEYHTYNMAEATPNFNIDMVLFGIDYGVSDNDTLCGIAWDTTNRRGYVFHEDKFNRLDIKDRTVSQLEYLKLRINYAWEKSLAFFPTLGAKEANKRIIWVADDNDQHLTNYFNINCHIAEHDDLHLNIMNAHKTDKVYMFDKIKDLFRTANLLLPVGGYVADECTKTVLKRGPNGQVYPEVEDKVYHPDILPALRYALWTVIGVEKENK